MVQDRLKVLDWARGVLARLAHYRSLRLTPEGVRFILLTLAVGIAALNTGNNLLYLLLAMLLSLIIVSGLLSEQCLRALHLRRQLPPHLFAGRSAQAALSVTNHKRRWPTFSLQLSDVVEGLAVDHGLRLSYLPPGQSQRRSYPLLFEKRGRYRMEAVKVRTRFPFGLFLKTATVPLEADLVVYPTPQPLPERLRRELTGAGRDHATSQRGYGVGLYNLREYHAGDDARAIHWKTSARQSRLMVRETEADDHRQVTLALPVRGPSGCPPADVAGDSSNAFERAVVLVASLAAYFHQRDFAVRLLLDEQDIPYGRGERHLHHILRALALCTPILSPDPAPIPGGFLALGAETAGGTLSLVVLPWEDPRVAAACVGASRLIRLGEDFAAGLGVEQ